MSVIDLLSMVLGWLVQHADWFIVFVFGVIVGAGELVSRHRDAPFAALALRPALMYLLVNGLASVVALALIHGTGMTRDQPAWLPVVIAGFGAMLLLRTAISIGTGPEKVTISLSTYFEQFRHAADEEVSRARGEDRGKLIQAILLSQGATYNQSKEALPAVCMALHRFVSADDRARLTATIRGLSRENSSLTDRQKLRLLGYDLLDIVGPGVLRAAVSDLGSEIVGAPEPGISERSKIVQEKLLDREVTYAKAKAILPEVCVSMVPSMDPEAAAALGTTQGKIEQSTFTDRQRLILLAYALLDRFDTGILSAAIDNLGDEIRGPVAPVLSPTPPPPPPTSTPPPTPASTSGGTPIPPPSSGPGAAPTPQPTPAQPSGTGAAPTPTPTPPPTPTTGQGPAAPPGPVTS